jgi:hypothetical protein
MKFDNVLTKLKEYDNECKSRGFTVTFKYDVWNYELCIKKGTKEVIIRDGYLNGKFHNKKSPNITSFDVLFRMDDATFLNYVSDYPFDEYLNKLMDSFFNDNYVISNDKVAFFWTKTYLHLKVNDKTYHLLQTNKRHHEL